jgi:Na+/proline symporter
MPLSPAGLFFLIAALVIYVVALIAIGQMAGGKVDNAADYLLAGRNVPFGLSVLSLLATWFGSSAILGATRNAYESGLHGTVLEPFACAATLAFTGFVFARPLWKRQVSTVADLFRQRMGPQAEWISCAIQVPTFFCWIGAQYLSIGALLESYVGLPAWAGAMGSCAVVLVILWSGGMWAVTWTNSFLIALSIASVVILFAGTAQTMGQGDIVHGVWTVMDQVPPEQRSFFPDWRLSTVLGVVGIFMTGLLGNVPGQDLQQRVLCARSPSIAQWSCIVCGIIYLIIGLIPVYVGFAARIQLPERIQEADVMGDRVLPIAASYFLSEPWVIVLVLGLLSVNLAVAASSTISQTTILANNIFGPWRGRFERFPTLEQVCVVVVSIGSLVAAFSGESVMGLLEMSLVIVMVSLFVPMCVCLFASSVHPWTGVASMLAGALGWGLHIAVETFLEHGPKANTMLTTYLDIPAGIHGLAASVAIAFFLQWRTSSPSKAT